MTKSWLAIIPLFLLPAPFSGCNKPEGLRTQSTYTFTNQTGKRISFDVYRTEEDYGLQQNRVHQYIIDSAATQPIVFDVAVKYWIDWYTADYSYNNWQSDRSSYNRSSPPPELNIAAEDEQMFIKQAVLDTARSVLLNGGGLTSKWRCTVTDNTQLNGTHEIILNKNFTGTYSYINSSGGNTQLPIEYIINTSSVSLGIPQGFTVYVLNAQQSSTIRLICNTGYQLTPHTGRDTMMIRFQQVSSADYPMVRQ